MSNWPASLQQILNADSFQVSFGNTTIRSDMDVGPAKVRSRFTDAVDIYTCGVNITYDQYTTLSDFYKTILNNGALPFTFDDPFTGSPESFRFVSPPTLAPLGQGGFAFRVSMSWEKMP